MTLSTIPQGNVDKKKRAKEIYDFHLPFLEGSGIVSPIILPKFPYKAGSADGPDENVVGLFTSEVAGKDVFIEFADGTNTPLDANRTLYKWRFNPMYETEYMRAQKGDSIRYLIPVSELIKVKEYRPDEEVKNEPVTNKEEQMELELDLSHTPTDLLLKDASIRDLAAIMWRKKVSNKQWINELIDE